MRLLLVVNSFASSVTARNTVLVHQALSQRRTTCRSSRRTAAATPPASPRTPPAAASTWSRPSVATAPSTRSRTASPARDDRAGRAARRLDQRVRPQHRAAQRSRRRRPRRSCRALKRAPLRRVGLGVGQRPLLLLPHRRRLRRRRRPARSRSAASVKRWVGPPAVHLRRRSARGSRSYDRTQPHFAVELPDAATSVPDGYFTVVLNTNPYTYLGNRAFDLSPVRRPRPGAGGHHVPHA